MQPDLSAVIEAIGATGPRGRRRLVAVAGAPDADLDVTGDR